MAAADPAKRVLIVHSFSSAAPPFTIHSIAFETELTGRLGARVDLDEVSLDHARYAGAEVEGKLVDYLQSRQAKWQPDLVVPIGSPAGIFVERYRERLFPGTPVLYTGMDRRRLAADALQKNAAFVGESFDGPGFIEDILQLAPDTTNIVCVIGASQVERYWAAALQGEFARFTNRVSFTWLNDLPFDQMLSRMKKLPARSFIFLILLMKDAAGVTHNADEALRQIREVANAPVNSIYEEQLGLGIVGGRLYRAQFEGEESARVAVRILRGEPPSGFQPEIVGPKGTQYDWRELQRWKIGLDRLPPGSIVKYRVPTVWERYRFLVVSGLSVLVVQGLLIVGLVMNLRRRRKAERSLRESEQQSRRLEQELAHVGRVSTLGALAGSLAHELSQPLSAMIVSADTVEQLVKGGGPTNGEMREALKDIRKQGKRAGEIIAGIRGMLKKDPGQMAAQDVNLAVREVLEMVRSDLRSRRVTPVLRLDPLLPPVNGHGVQLRQVVLNLIMNACDAMSEAPANQRTLTVESRCVTAGEVEISVTDGGPGFKQEMLGHPFEPFQTTKAKGLWAWSDNMPVNYHGAWRAAGGGEQWRHRRNGKGHAAGADEERDMRERAKSLNPPCSRTEPVRR